mgnify:CR=1 FL=1
MQAGVEPDDHRQIWQKLQRLRRDVPIFIRGKGDPIQLDYRLEKKDDGWKIYDVNVLGVWLVQNYTSSFAQEIGANGIDGLIAKLAERNRTELRERIADILNPDQKKKYAEIIAEIAGRQSSRGRLFVLDAGGGPRAVAVRTGLTDGAFTEVSGEGLKEGDTIIVGVQTAGAPAQKSAAPAVPRLPF